MAHADPAGARKRTTRKTKLTRDEDAFHDLSLPTVPLSSALDPKLPPDPVESHKSGTPSGAAQALTPQQLRTGDPASPDYLTQRISLVQAEREKLALELELLRFSTKWSGINRSYFHHQEKAHCSLAARFYTRYVYQPWLQQARISRICRQVSCHDKNAWSCGHQTHALSSRTAYD